MVGGYVLSENKTSNEMKMPFIFLNYLYFEDEFQNAFHKVNILMNETCQNSQR